MNGIAVIPVQGAGQLPFQRPGDGLHLVEIPQALDQARGPEHLFDQGMVGQPSIARHLEQIRRRIAQVAGGWPIPPAHRLHPQSGCGTRCTPRQFRRSTSSGRRSSPSGRRNASPGTWGVLHGQCRRSAHRDASIRAEQSVRRSADLSFHRGNDGTCLLAGGKTPQRLRISRAAVATRPTPAVSQIAFRPQAARAAPKTSGAAACSTRAGALSHPSRAP